MSTWIIIAVAAIAAIAAAAVYNNLVVAKNNVKAAWANIDPVLQQRHDELGKLVDACRQYMKFESELLNEITSLRMRYGEETDPQARIAIANELSAKGAQLSFQAEAYPELKSSENVLQLQNAVSAVESKLADFRETFNNAVNTYNIVIERLPDVILARLLGYRPKGFLEVPEAAKADVQIKLA
jgi:LemA protein